MDDQSLHDMMDACRASGDDLQGEEFHALRERLGAEPKLRAGLERLLQLDSELSIVFRQVPVPDGLLERLMAGMVSPAAAADQAGSAARVGHWRVGRRTWAAAALAVAACWVTAVGLSGLVLDRPQFRTADELEAEALVWSVVVNPSAWQPLNPTIATDYPPPPKHQLAAYCVVWQRLRVPALEVMCYGVTWPDGSVGHLFVLPAHKARVRDQRPPAQPFSTQGRNAGAWRHSGLVYVVVLEGPANRYRSLVRPGSGMAAWRRPLDSTQPAKSLSAHAQRPPALRQRAGERAGFST
jgi:hypothetical protein